MTGSFFFHKNERLCSQKLLDQLFSSGHRLMAFPYSICWMVVPDTQPYPVQVLITTSKRKFHHAVDRNRVKRLTRECYRTHKPRLYDFLKEHNLHIVLSLNYVHTELPEFHTLDKKFDKLIDKLIETIAHEENL